MRLTSWGFAVTLAVIVACDEGPGTIGIATTGGGSTTATHLAFTAQPAGTQFNNSSIIPALQVSALSLTGTADTSFGAVVTLSMGANPGSATLGGSTQVAAIRGVATFNNLTISATTPGSGFSLAASTSGISGATSAAFSVSP